VQIWQCETCWLWCSPEATFGWHKLLESEGIFVDIDGQLHHVYGSILTFTSEVLLRHALAGFSTCFSSGHTSIHLCKKVLTHFYSEISVVYRLLVSLAKTCTRRKSFHSQCGVSVVPIQFYENRLAITTKKYNDLECLCTTGAISQMFHQEYLSLPVDETVEECLAETDEEDP
jgi:hypothetical protein